MSPYNWVIYLMTQPQVAYQQKKRKKNVLTQKKTFCVMLIDFLPIIKCITQFLIM